MHRSQRNYLQVMRYIFASHDRAFQIKRIREGIEAYRAEEASDPEGFQMHPVYDDILGQLGQHFLAHWSDRIAIVGLGGYGRREMSPYSDIDLLFLRPENAPEGVYRGIRGILHLLWDAKVEVGHSVRTIDECNAEAAKDLAVLTSLMDVRHVWGDDRIYRQLIVERERMINEADPLDFYLRIEAEILKCCSEFGHTIYMLEPYVKEGPGSLRYMQLIAWLAKLIFGSSGLEDLPSLGITGHKALDAAQAGLHFLGGIRTRLHLLAGRRDDRLRFDAQSVLAEQMGFHDTEERRGVELFMREYYRHAATMEHFGQRVLARSRLFLRPETGAEVKRMKLDDSFYLGAGGIYLYDERDVSLTATDMLKAFRWVAETGANLDIRLMDLIRTSVRPLERDLANDPTVNAHFLAIFRNRGSIAKAVTAMLQTGFLEWFIPEFQRVAYLRQHDAYHQYTVDRHTMVVLEFIDSFARREDGDDVRLMRNIFASLAKPEVLYLAALFHDVGKGQGAGHEIRGEKIARRVLERIGLPKGDREDVCFLIRDHLAMSHLAFKKDLHDEALLSRFGENVMHKRRLDMLLLLTHADLSAVGPRGLNSWRRLLLEELYYRTLDVFERESAEGEDLGEWIEEIKAVIRDLTPADMRGDLLEEFLEGSPARYLLDFYPGVIVDHYTAIVNYLRSHGKSALDADDVIVSKVDHLGPGYSSVTLLLRDRPGLFYKLAGTLSANRINIHSAWSHSIHPDIAVATFHVHDLPQGPVVDPHQWDRFCSDVCKVIRGESDVDELVAARRRSGRLFFSVPTPSHPLKVEIDNAASDNATIVEVYALDRPGLLYDITRQIYTLGLSITITKITTEVDLAADIFYVVDENGNKIVDFERLDEIENSLRDHLIAIEESLIRDRKSA